MSTPSDLASLDLDTMLKRLHLPTVRGLCAQLEERVETKATFPLLGTIEDLDSTFRTSVRVGLLGSCVVPLVYWAIHNRFEARFATAVPLIEELSNAARAARLAGALHDYRHHHSLVVDEVTYLTLQDNAANVPLQVANERHLA